MPTGKRQPRRWWQALRRWWQALGRPVSVVVLAALFAVIWWLVPPLLYRHTGAGPDARLKAITDTRTALLAGLVGVGALLTFWLNSRVYRITAQTLQVSQEGQITERYTKAIEQLGSDKLDVRLGGIYALERIAADSERDHPTVVEVLSAFVREHSDPKAAQLATPEAAGRTGLPTDVQAGLTVLGRLPHREYVSRGDLNGAHLRGADLRWKDLHQVNLQHADLREAQLQEADLLGAELQGAELEGAKLKGANLEGAKLWKATLKGANLYGANLQGADLHEANLLRTFLQQADLTGADLPGAKLQEATLRGAILQEADLTGADLEGATLWGAVANGETVWPDGFALEATGIVMMPAESAG
jgi:uncharacterized protein YjbI with pentapeptide repeats